MRALLTAFGPFMDREQNQSQMVLELCLRRLPQPWRAQLLPVHLPWVLELAAARAADPDLAVWLAMGEAGEAGDPCLETRARNAYDLRRDASSAGGLAPEGPLEAAGPATVSALFPAEALARHLTARGHRLGLSADAGAHCCNALLYAATRVGARRRDAPRIGFLHLPRRPEEAALQAALVLDALRALDPGGELQD